MHQDLPWNILTQIFRLLRALDFASDRTQPYIHRKRDKQLYFLSIVDSQFLSILILIGNFQKLASYRQDGFVYEFSDISPYIVEVGENLTLVDMTLQC